MEYVLALLIIGGFAALYFKKENNINNSTDEEKKRISELEQENSGKEENIRNLQNTTEILNAKMSSFEQLKTEKIQITERLKLAEVERNNLKNENTKLNKEEDNRNETLRKSIESTNTLQNSLKLEKERLNDDRVKEMEEKFEKMKLTWGEHEKDVEKHIRMICQNLLLTYIPQEETNQIILLKYLIK